MTPPKPPADALPDVKPRPRFRLWQHLHNEHKLTLLESEVDEIIILAVAANNAEWQELYPDFVRVQATIASLETSLRSSEAALAEARQLTSVLSADLQDAQERLNVEEADHFYEEEKLTAELTALRANAGEDSRLLDWLEVNKGRCGYSEQTYIGEGYFAHEYTQGDKYEAAPTLRDAIRAAMPAPSGLPAKLAPPPTTASGAKTD